LRFGVRGVEGSEVPGVGVLEADDEEVVDGDEGVRVGRTSNGLREELEVYEDEDGDAEEADEGCDDGDDGVT
jgi:hypothetical protein